MSAVGVNRAADAARSPEPDFNRGPLTSSSSSSSDHHEYRVYKRRWLVLLALAILNVSNAVTWISFAPIADLTGTYFGVTADQVNWLSLVYMVVTLVLGFVAIWIMDVRGLRVGLLLCAWINAVGAIVKMLSTFSFVPQGDKYAVVLTGQAIAGVAQPFCLFASTKLAALWFHENERAISNTLGSMANPLGVLLGSLVTPFVVTEAKHMQLLLEILAGPAVFAALYTTVAVRSERPPTPPSASAAEQSTAFFRGLRLMFRNRNYWLLLVTVGGGVALFTALTTVLQEELCPNGYSDSFAGIGSGLMLGCGIVGAGIAGLVVDKTKKYNEVAKFSFGMSVLAAAFFTIISRYSNQQVLIATSLGLFGFFGFALYPVCLELGAEVTYPVAEATSSGFILMSGQLQGIVYLVLMQVLEQPASRKRSTCQNDPSDFTYSNILFLAVAAVGSITLITFLKPDYRRLRAEQGAAAAAILGYSEASFPQEPQL